MRIERLLGNRFQSYLIGNIMETFGYIAFAVLLYLSITWTVGVRQNLSVGVHTIFGALLFVTFSVILAVTELNNLHSLWMIPTGFAIAVVVPLLAVHFPSVFQLIRYLASLYANLVRVGIPPERIRAALEADAVAQMQAFMSKDERTDR